MLILRFACVFFSWRITLHPIGPIGAAANSNGPLKNSHANMCGLIVAYRRIFRVSSVWSKSLSHINLGKSGSTHAKIDKSGTWRYKYPVLIYLYGGRWVELVDRWPSTFSQWSVYILHWLHCLGSVCLLCGHVWQGVSWSSCTPWSCVCLFYWRMLHEGFCLCCSDMRSWYIHFHCVNELGSGNNNQCIAWWWVHSIDRFNLFFRGW